MKTLLLLLFPALIQAQQFTGYYALDKWTVTKSEYSKGSINYDHAPESVTVNGSTGEMSENVDTDLTIAIDRAGVYSFEWEYNTEDILPRYDIAGVTLNGSFKQLNTNNGGSYQTGVYVSAFLDSGTVLGFKVRSSDNLNQIATFKVKSFKFPEKVIIVVPPPVPPALPDCGIRVYPNPARDMVRLQIGCFDGAGDILVYDAIGRLLDKIKTGSGIIDYNVGRYPAGVYMFLYNGNVFRVVKL